MRVEIQRVPRGFRYRWRVRLFARDAARPDRDYVVHTKYAETLPEARREKRAAQRKWERAADKCRAIAERCEDDVVHLCPCGEPWPCTCYRAAEVLGLPADQVAGGDYEAAETDCQVCGKSVKLVVDPDDVNEWDHDTGAVMDVGPAVGGCCGWLYLAQLDGSIEAFNLDAPKQEPYCGRITCRGDSCEDCSRALDLIDRRMDEHDDSRFDEPSCGNETCMGCDECVAAERGCGEFCQGCELCGPAGDEAFTEDPAPDSGEQDAFREDRP